MADRTPVSSTRARLGSLRVKFFLAIAGANALLALLAYAVFAWSFDRGFVDYLNEADEARLNPLIARLAEGYQREQGWDWIANDPHRWSDLSRDALGLPRGRRGGGGEEGGQPQGQPPPAAARAPDAPLRTPPLTIDPRLLLFDAARTKLIGRDEQVPDAVLKPIVVGAAAVGYLGYVPRLQLAESIERVFSARQRRQFAAIAVGMLAAALLIGAGLAYWLTRRIGTLERGAGALIRGDYDMRLDARGHDELDKLARDFNILAETLAATRRARQQWIADIAHELRTPLSVLRGEIEAIEDGVRPLDRAGLRSLAQEVAHLGRLVEDLHLLSMSDLGALNQQREPLDLGALLHDTLAMHGRALAERGLALDAELADGVAVLADPTRLAQVFDNLMQNTLRYTDAPGRLAVRLRRAGEGAAARAVVDWMDSAPGVADADLARLTERLYRVDASRSRAGGGSGLGLAIVQAIVEAHEGRLVARHGPAGGVWIEISLPAHPS